MVVRLNSWILKSFTKIAITEVGGKSGKSYIGRIRKTPGIHPRYQFCDFHSQLRLANENFDISWKSA